MNRLLLVVAVASALASGATWTEATRADFVDGVVDAQMYISHRARLDPDSGCVEFFSRFDVDNNGYYDLACSDDSGPLLTLYVGSAAGYSPASRLDYGVTSGGNVDLADLNLDGQPELIHSGWRSGQTVIYWGTLTGPSPTDTTALGYSGQGEDVNVYDLDRDGYLDIIVGSSAGNLYFFWGSAAGYSSSDRTTINLGYAIGHNTEIADFDQDGWGDIAVSMWTFNECPVIYWGPGRQPRNTTWLPFRWNNGHGITVGDFNRDDWLDIVYTGYDTVITSLIYFGSSTGFDSTNYYDIHPGRCYGGSAATDWNNDGWLDLVFFRGNWTQGGRWKPVIYYNSGAAPFFADSNQAELGTDTLNASGGFIADFDFDGSIDIFVNNMLPNDSSYVIWGPDHLRRTALPVESDHHGVFREPGSSYDRSQTARYFSSIYDAGTDSVAAGATASWVAFEPPGSRVAVFFRSGNTPNPDSSWNGFRPVPANGAQLPAEVMGRRFYQYYARFSYDRPCYLPDLERISTTFTLRPPDISDVGVVQVLAPVDTLYSGTAVTPAAVVRNFGNVTVTAPVRLLIGTTYSDSIATSLAPGAADTVSFSQWVAQPVGTDSVVCFTYLPGDQNPANDTSRGAVVVVPPPTVDVGPIAIVAPLDSVDSGTVIVPQVTLHNFGSQAATFPVFLTIGAGYLDSTSLTLAADQSDTVRFASWTATPVGALPVTCWSALTGDQNPRNDTVRSTVIVPLPPHLDVGPTAILAPIGTVDSGTTVLPQALVHNFGNTTVSAPVRLLIGTTYSDSTTISIAAGATDTARFSAWNATTVGSFPVLCYTTLAEDENPLNDAVRDSVVVPVPPHADVGPTAIVAPVDSVDSGTVITPQATFRNFGNQPVTCGCHIRIGANWGDSTAVSLEPGADTLVRFRPWSAAPLESLTVTCYTRLATDENPANDTIRSGVTVCPLPLLDVAPVAILAPLGFVDSGRSVTPLVVVGNLGSLPATFPVHLTIGASYADSSNVDLAPGGSDTITFAPWIAAPAGILHVVCYTALAGDERPQNDTLRDSVAVAAPALHDVGTAAIAEPSGRIAAGDTVWPRAFVRNFGTVVERFFDVRFRIGIEYDARVACTTPLIPGAEAEVTFPPWVASSGDFAVSCSTELARDANPANDRIASAIHIGPPLRLDLESDIFDHIEAGRHRVYSFTALLSAEQSEAAIIDQVVLPAGWNAWYVNPADGSPLNGLGTLLPGQPRTFGLLVEAPSGNLAGVVDSLPEVELVIRGRLATDEGVQDSVRLQLQLVPNLEVHNYPNPIRLNTVFVIGLPDAGQVTLTIYNRAGECVRRLLDHAELTAQVHQIPWNATNDAGRRVARGVYDYVFEFTAAGQTSRIARKVIVARE